MRQLYWEEKSDCSTTKVINKVSQAKFRACFIRFRLTENMLGKILEDLFQLSLRFCQNVADVTKPELTRNDQNILNMFPKPDKEKFQFCRCAAFLQLIDTQKKPWKAAV